MAEPTDAAALRARDVTLTVPANGAVPLANHMLQDAVHMARFLRVARQRQEGAATGTVKPPAVPTAPAEVEPLARGVVRLLTRGKAYERAMLRSVPFPYMSGPGRILDRDGTGWREVPEPEAVAAIGQMLLEQFRQDLDLSASPYKEFLHLLEREAEAARHLSDFPIRPEVKDILLFPCGSTRSLDDDAPASASSAAVDPDQPPEADMEKAYDTQLGNNFLLNLASQFVSSLSNTPERRVKAALSVLQGLDDIDVIVPRGDQGGAAATAGMLRRPRFLVGTTSATGEESWRALTLIEAAEFVNSFVFEVWLEKEPPALALEETAEPDTTTPIKNPAEYDVLLGRGGLTNAWAGNRRFRDVIALHRPDYIRAIKMDKPAVARKIVRAIRLGKPPGRFLRKGENGLWYDVGDKTAAEKTSQGLRERTNIEKRQRTELRKALRIRKTDLEDFDTEASPAKRSRQSDTAISIEGSLNYVGTSLPVPLSLTVNMGHVASIPKRSSSGKSKVGDALVTEGLPPNAVDTDGNILVTDYDILVSTPCGAQGIEICRQHPSHALYLVRIIIKCGRGGLTNHHKGNRRFRDIVALHRPDYVRAPKVQKPSVARVIVRAIRNGDPPGRFLKKDEKTGRWIDIGDKKAAAKTSQALREKADDENLPMKMDSGSLGVILPITGYLEGTTASVIGNLVTTNPGAPPNAGNSKAHVDDLKKTGDEKAKNEKQENHEVQEEVQV